MTELQIQQIIHRIYEKDNTPPSSTSEDYLVRRSFMNVALQKWGDKASEESMSWNDLYTNLSDAGDGDTEAVEGTIIYDAPSDFVHISSFVKIAGEHVYTYRKNDEVMRTLTVDPSARIFYITGRQGAKKININNAVTGTIAYSYYKTPTEYTTTSSVSEIPKPYYIVYEVLSTLFEEERPDLANKYITLAKNLMDAMILENEIAPFNNTNAIEDMDYKLDGSTFGT